MVENASAIDRVYQDVDPELTRHAKNGTADGLNAAFQKLHSVIHSLSRESSPERFAKAWLLQALVNEWLRYAIEDDYADLSGEAHHNGARSLAGLLRRDDWLDADLVAFLDACREIATTRSLSPQKVRFRSEHFDGYFRLAQADRPPIPVSSKSYLGVPILEDSITDPTCVGPVVDAFAERLARLKREDGITCLCFIEKAAGPVGALGMVAALVRELQLPASIYRAAYWAQAPRLVGYQPTTHDRIALIYDLLVTGDGVREAARDLRDTYDVQTVAAVVLLAYDQNRVLTMDGEPSIKVEAIEGYDTFAKTIERIVKKNQSLESGTVFDVSSRRARSSPAKGRKRGSPPDKGGTAMTHRQNEWKTDLESYRELRALTFSSRDLVEQAIDLLWTEELRNLPHDLVGGTTIIVPTEAVRFFQEAGLKFTVDEVLSAHDLPEGELNELRKQGPY